MEELEKLFSKINVTNPNRTYLQAEVVIKAIDDLAKELGDIEET